MSKSNTFENDLLKLTFNGTPIANMADNASASPLTNLFVAAHTADPGEAGTQTTSEASYTGYTRATVARTTGGFTVTNNSVSPAAVINWPACTGGSSQTLTHFTIGVAVSGASKILYSGTITPNIAVSTGVTPQLSTATAITED